MDYENSAKVGWHIRFDGYPTGYLPFIKIRFVETVVSALSEKSLLVVMGLTLGLIITWLITSDPNNAALQAHRTNLVGMNAP